MQGYINFINVECFFSFDGDIISLIPYKNKLDNIRDLFKEKNSLKLEKNFLEGNLINGELVRFYLDSMYAQFNNGIVTLKVSCYFKINMNCGGISKIKLYNEEINKIYPPDRYIKYSYDCIPSVEKEFTYKYQITKPRYIEYECQDKKIKMCFRHNLVSDYIENLVPIRLHSFIRLEFEQTNDFEFIMEVINSVYNLIAFLFNRKDISTFKCELVNNEDVSIGEYYVSNSRYVHLSTNQDPLKFFIPYENIESIIDFLMPFTQKEANLRHIHKTYRDSKEMTADRIIFTVAFTERLYEEYYSNKTAKWNQEDCRIKNYLNEQNQKLTDENVREIIKQNNYWNEDGKIKNNLLIKLYIIFEHMKDICPPYISYIYDLNSINIKNIVDGCKVIKKVRNDDAHCNDFNSDLLEESALIIALERINYAIILKYYGLDDKVIQDTLRSLFGIIV